MDPLIALVVILHLGYVLGIIYFTYNWVRLSKTVFLKSLGLSLGILAFLGYLMLWLDAIFSLVNVFTKGFFFIGVISMILLIAFEVFVDKEDEKQLSTN